MFRLPWQHGHKLTAMRVQHAKVPAGLTGERVDATIVLRSCSCGAFDTVTLNGTWTLDEIRGVQVHEEVASLLARTKAGAS